LGSLFGNRFCIVNHSNASDASCSILGTHGAFQLGSAANIIGHGGNL